MTALALLVVGCFSSADTMSCLACTPLGTARSATPSAPLSSSDLSALLAQPILDPDQPGADVRAYVQARVPSIPVPQSVAAWEQYASDLRRQVLERLVFRGEAARWRDADCRVQWLDAIDGGPGYSIRKLRYEALPGLWIPALLYEPDNLEGKVPVVLNVNGHDRDDGKAVAYKQIRCINQAKRGMLALNVEWLGMGQLHTEGFRHTRMNQLDLCGTSGLAPFYLAMQRGLDVLLAHEHADPERVAVTGLSGGGWQTILISALDPRVTLAVPVAGYGSFHSTSANNDFGDSEQAPCDLATVADYGHLTALLAPRPTLLIYNAEDDCCFRAAHTLPALLQAARPVFAIYGKEDHLTSHVNHDPGTHNYEQDNREALYRVLGRHFYGGDPPIPPLSREAAALPLRGGEGGVVREIASADEVKAKEQLHVDLPADNADFHTLAMQLAKDLPRHPELPTTREAIEAWQKQRRHQLRELVRCEQLRVDAAAQFARIERSSGRQPLRILANSATGAAEGQGTHAVFRKLRLSGRWTVPAVELSRGEPGGTTILVADGGRASAAQEAERLLAAGRRVLAVDPFYVGESRIQAPDPAYTYALLLDCFGRRPLALQADQLAAVARWAGDHYDAGPVAIAATGPRCSLAALLAAALETDAIGAVHVTDSLASLKQVIERNLTAEEAPELFCFGLLEQFDVAQIAALVAPRKVTVAGADDRTRRAWAALGPLFEALDGKIDFTAAASPTADVGRTSSPSMRRTGSPSYSPMDEGGD